MTLAQYFRRPTTVQYPDRTRVPVVDSLPERYRGFLEVDMDICTACKACERDCPINVIAIDVEKRGGERVMTRFDIDMGKCMYCGICVESCPVPAQAPGDAEPTKCIRMTREFEGATSDFPSLTFRFVKRGRSGGARTSRKKGAVPATPERGIIAREVRQRARSRATRSRSAGRLAQQAGGELAELVAARGGAGARRGAGRARGGGDRGDRGRAAGRCVRAARSSTRRWRRPTAAGCGWPTCRAYADAIAAGRERALGKCEPGGAKSTRDVNLLVQLRRGASRRRSRQAGDDSRP